VPTYLVEIKNVSANTADMLMAVGGDATVTEHAEDEHAARLKAVRRFFPAMGLWREDIATSDATNYYQLTYKNSQYGRIRVRVTTACHTNECA